MPVAVGTKMPYSQSARHRIPSGKQLVVLDYLKRNPGVSIADLCRAIDGFVKREGSAMYVTVRRMIRRGFVTTKVDSRNNRYRLFNAWNP